MVIILNFIKDKRELNNILFRKFHSSTDKLVYLNMLIENNEDLIEYTINMYFKNLEFNSEICNLCKNSMIKAFENYEMDKICDLESFIIANIKSDLENYLNSKTHGKTLKKTYIMSKDV